MRKSYSSSALVETSFFKTIGASLVEKTGFYLTHGNKRISNRNLFLMWHILQQIEIKIRNAMRCDNRNDLLHLSFTLKISMFSEAYVWPSRISMMKLLLRK